MARTISPERRKCQSCLDYSNEQAQARECWAGRSCTQYRSQLRRRRQANLRRRVGQVQASTGAIAIQSPAMGVLHLYKDSRQDAPLHSFQAEVWAGGEVVFRVDPVHTVGMDGKEIQGAIAQALELCREAHGVQYFDSGSVIVHAVSVCPVTDCPCFNK